MSQEGSVPAEHAQERAPAPAQADDQSKQQQQKIDKLLADVKKLQAEADKWKQEAEQAKAEAAQSSESAGSAADSKVKELSKKNRELNLQLQRAQDDANKARTAAASGDPQAMSYTAKKQQAKVDEESATEIKRLKKLHNDGVNQLGKQTSANAIMTNERKNLEAFILKEFGGHVDLRSVADGSATKRKDVAGENQMMKAQLAELRKGKGEADASSPVGGDNRGGLIWKQRHSGAIAELDDLKEEMRDLRITAEGSISSRNICHKELSKARAQIKMLIEKSMQDDRLVGTLQAQIAKLQRGEQDATTMDELAMLRDQCLRQEAQLDRQEQMILALQAQEEETRDAAAQETAPQALPRKASTQAALPSKVATEGNAEPRSKSKPASPESQAQERISGAGDDAEA